MVKSGSERSDKYAAKFDAEVVRSRYSATADTAKAKQVTQQQVMADLAAYVRNALNAKGISPLQTIIYMSYANKLQGIKNKFGQGVYGTTPYNTAMVAYNNWKAEGADSDILADIFTHVIGSAPSPL
jgi:hypothetical protein